jgi:hypothetical protein
LTKNLVDEEEPPNLLIMRMGLGEVRPREVQAQTSVEERNNDSSSSTRVEPPSSQQTKDQSQVHGDDQVHGINQGENKVGMPKKMLHKLMIMMATYSTSVTSASSKSSSKSSMG